MRSEWKSCSLDDLAKFENGKSLSPALYSSDGANPVFGSNGEIAKTNEELNSDSVISIGRVGAYCGSVYLIKTPSWVTDNAIIAKPKGDNDLRYLYYRLLSLDLRRTAIGSAQPLMTQGGLKIIETTVPSSLTQKAIADILGSLDDKIELNRKTNETLEAMAQAIFKSWFIDFDPVHAKSKGRQPDGMDAETAKLFPSSFQDSEIGMVPKGWEAKRLDEVLMAKNDRCGEMNVPEYSSTNDGLQLRSERFTKQLSVSTSANKLIKQGDLVFGLSRQVLNFGLMRDPVGGVSAAYKVFAVDENAIIPDLLERMIRMRSGYFFNALSASSREGQSVSSDGLGRLRFVQPSSAVQVAFYEVTEGILQQSKCLQQESRSLVSLRDELIPRLLSGEITIPVSKVA